MNKTDIEYLTHTWSPIAMRCTPVSEGCKNCWHLRMADRLAANHAFPFDVRRAYAGEGPPVLVEERLVKPLNRKKPARIGVQFMGDLFYKNVPPTVIKEVWRVMLRCPQHVFQMLTKRPARMNSFLHGWYTIDKTFQELPHNIWLGVSVENQARANERIPLLLQIPAAVRFVSCEPLLGPIDLLPWLRPYPNCGNVAEDGTCASSLNPTPECHVGSCPMTDVHQGISWCIVGGESGPGARPMHPQWARDIRDQCQAANVPLFFKQHGEWLHSSQVGLIFNSVYQILPNARRHYWDDNTVSSRVGKKRAGHLLDGEEWIESPAPNAASK